MKGMFKVGVAALLLVSLAISPVFAGGEAEDTKGSVELLYVEWAGEVAATYVAQVLLEEMGYSVTATSVSAAAMWEGIAAGAADAHLAAWLPGTHGEYLEQTEDRLEVLSPILEGARIGLLVPTYVDIDTVEEIEEHADRFDNRIVGIDPGAGLMQATEEAIEVYGLDSVELIEGSDATMVAELDRAYNDEDWIVVTGWTPHIKEAMFDLKYLEDPELVFGEEEYVAAVVREGLAEDMPEVYEFLDNFYWTPDQVASLMLINDEGGDPYDNAKAWVEDNRDIVEDWLP
jgi:glycine betaine/proline transport system substrate-binding protein